MSMFPGAHAQIIRNDVGEPVGWDYPSDDDPYNPDDFLPGDDEDEDEGEDHRFNPAPFCAKCEGPCEMRET